MRDNNKRLVFSTRTPEIFEVRLEKISTDLLPREIARRLRGAVLGQLTVAKRALEAHIWNGATAKLMRTHKVRLQLQGACDGVHSLVVDTKLDPTKVQWQENGDVLPAPTEGEAARDVVSKATQIVLALAAYADWAQAVYEARMDLERGEMPRRVPTTPPTAFFTVAGQHVFGHHWEGVWEATLSAVDALRAAEAASQPKAMDELAAEAASTDASLELAEEAQALADILAEASKESALDRILDECGIFEPLAEGPVDDEHWEAMTQWAEFADNESARQIPALVEEGLCTRFAADKALSEIFRSENALTE